RNINTYNLFPKYPSFTFTGNTFSRDGSSLPITIGAGSNSLHLTQEGIANPPYLSTPPTGTTGLHTGFIFSTTAMTGGTGYMFFYLDVFIDAFGDLFITEFDFYPQI